MQRTCSIPPDVQKILKNPHLLEYETKSNKASLDKL
jgi:hypothetical protein